MLVFIFEHHGYLRTNPTSHCVINEASDYRNSPVVQRTTGKN